MKAYCEDGEKKRGEKTVLLGGGGAVPGEKGETQKERVHPPPPEMGSQKESSEVPNKTESRKRKGKGIRKK